MIHKTAEKSPSENEKECRYATVGGIPRKNFGAPVVPIYSNFAYYSKQSRNSRDKIKKVTGPAHRKALVKKKVETTSIAKSSHSRI